MSTIRISNIDIRVTKREVFDFLAGSIYARDPESISFEIETDGTKSTIVLLTRKSALRSVRNRSFRGRRFNVDHELFGFTVLSEGRQPTIDIVALHGLNGHAFDTWTSNGTGCMWLRDLLPRDIPRARILTFGYNANIHDGAGTGLIRDFVREFLPGLRHMRTRNPTRGLILIGHSLGGLVMKEALIFARGEANCQDIVDSLRGLVFLGTPHQGSDSATFSLYLAKVAKAVNLNTRSDLIRTLERNSDQLFESAYSFSRFLSAIDLRIKTFYENRRTEYGWCILKKRFLVVDKGSATIMSQSEEPIPLNANHSGICKFRNSRDPNYTAVRDATIELVQRHRVKETRAERLMRKLYIPLQQILAELTELTRSQEADKRTLRNALEYLRRRPLDQQSGIEIVTELKSIAPAVRNLKLEPYAARISNELEALSATPDRRNISHSAKNKGGGHSSSAPGNRSDNVQRRGDEFQQRDDEVRRREDEVRRRGEEAQRHSEEAQRWDDEFRRRGDEFQRMDDEFQRHDEEVRRRDDEVRRRGEEAQRRGGDVRRHGD